MWDLWAFGSLLKSGNTFGGMTILVPIALTFSMSNGQFMFPASL